MVIGPMPERPCATPSHNWPTDVPSGLTAPIPVTTTRCVASLAARLPLTAPAPISTASPVPCHAYKQGGREHMLHAHACRRLASVAQAREGRNEVLSAEC